VSLDVVKFIKQRSSNYGDGYSDVLELLAEDLSKAMEVEYVEPLYRTDYSGTGSGPFPVDMLRYTQSWPKTEGDARAIEDSHEQAGYNDQFTVRLTKCHRDQDPGLSEDRWTSKFRWKLVGVVETVEL